MREMERRAEASPQSGSELRPPVAGDGAGDAKPLGPALKEGRGCAVSGVVGGEQESFRPPSHPIYDCKQIQKPEERDSGPTKSTCM